MTLLELTNRTREVGRLIKLPQLKESRRSGRLGPLVSVPGPASINRTYRMALL